MTTESPQLIRLAPTDNVLVAARSLDAGTDLRSCGIPVALAEAVALGHKIASRAIPKGEKILKYGVAIGSASADISAGSVVHLHNMKSDYLPTYLRGEGGATAHGH